MAFLRSGIVRNTFLVFQRFKGDGGIATNVARMSTQSAVPPPKGPDEWSRSSMRSTGFAALGGLLAFGGIGYVYKSLTDEKFGFSNQSKWIWNQLGWEEPKTLPDLPNADAKSTSVGSETQASCAGKDDCAPKCEDSNCLRRMEKEEELIAKANQELEKALKDVKPKAMEATEVALKAYCEAADIIKQFMDKAYCAIEEDNMDSPRFEEVWCDVYETALKRCEKVKDAMVKGQCAWELICRLREVIENGKNCKYTQCNPLLVTAEETLLCAERELLNAKSRMDCVQSESRLVEQYRNLVEDFRRDLKAEVESMLTGNSECKSTFTDNECAMILTHAYKKVLRIQKELSQVQATAFTDELAAYDTPSGLALKKKIDEMREYFEGELLKTLARQAQVYQENFQMIKSIMQAEYDRKLRQKSDISESESLVELRAKNHQAEIALDAMEIALSDRRSHDDRTENLRRLWTHCNTLYSQINYAGHGADDTNDVTVVINKDRLLNEFSEDEFIVLLLKTIPDVVGNSEGLKERFFNKVDRTCRRVAVFKKEENITLWKYIIGHIQGVLVSRCEGDKSTSKDVYELLDRTGFYLRRGEFLQAVSTLSKLDGIPREVCQDWIKDAVSILEASQTLYALMTHVNAKSIYPIQTS